MYLYSVVKLAVNTMPEIKYNPKGNPLCTVPCINHKGKCQKLHIIETNNKEGIYEVRFSNFGCNIPRQPNSSKPPKIIKNGKLINIAKIEIGLFIPKEIQIINKRQIMNKISTNHILGLISFPKIYFKKDFSE